MPFTLSIFSRRKTSWVIRNEKAERVVQVGEPASKGYRQLAGRRTVRSRYCVADLFQVSLKRACETAGIVDANGPRTISPHCFRHTVSTQLAERSETAYHLEHTDYA